MFNPISDNSFYDGYKPSVELESFFSRPVTIANITWTESSSLTYVFNPWTLYFSDTRVKKKLDNFAYLSCNLHLKFMVNASPFYYGMAIASYQPKKNFNGCRIYTASANRQAMFVPISQRPHVYMYPQNCQGGEIILPYINQKNWIRINSTSDFDNMGEMVVTELVQLANANGVTGKSVNITVYAWAEDVRLAGLTNNLALQSDEYEGPISGPASSVAKFSKSLSGVPIIGKFATATSIGANAVASIARLFGFTNVPTLASQHPVRNDPFFNISSSDLSAPMDKLTLDAKNELTIDPRVIGLSPRDELAISNIATRESFYFTFNWFQTNTYNDLLYNMRITPSLHRTSLDSGAIKYYLTPQHMLAEMFHYWRGDIIVRFKVIATRYHKGRLRISWDPDADIYAATDTMNVVFTKIVDIANEQDFEIRIPYQQSAAFCKTDVQPGNNANSGTSALGHNINSDNGILTVRVYNTLTSPETDDTIQIAVFVRGADNLEFAAPKNIDRTWTTFQPQAEQLDYPDVCMNTTEIYPSSEPDNLYLVYMGEVVKSLRPLLRRSCYVYSAIGEQDVDATKTLQTNTFTLPKRIPCYGYDPNGKSTTSGVLVPASTFNANFVHNIPLNWVSQCFIGSRGSILYRLNVNRSIQSSSVTISRQKRPHGSIAPSLDYTQPTDSANMKRYFQWITRESGSAGIVLQNTVTQTGINFLLPMYSLYRMISTDPTYVYREATDGDDTDNDSMRITITSRPSTQPYNVESSSALEVYAAAGTDYSVFFFLNVPTLWRVTLPAPTT